MTVFREKSGYEGTDAPQGAFIGSNGLTLDSEQRLIICEHGNGRVTRLEKDGKLTVLADKYQGNVSTARTTRFTRKMGRFTSPIPRMGSLNRIKTPKRN